jgi:hypothetical protein
VKGFLSPLIFASWFNALCSVLKGSGRKKSLLGPGKYLV